MNVALAVYALDAAVMLAGVATLSRVGPRHPALVLRAIGIALFVAINTALVLWFDCGVRAIAFVMILLALSSLTLREGQTTHLERALGRWNFPVYLAAVVTTASLAYIHLPITTYFSSNDEVAIRLGAMIFASAKGVVSVVWGTSILYLIALTRRMRVLLATTAVIALAVAFVFSFVYPFGYPLMNGLTFEQIPLDRRTLALRVLVDIGTIAIVVVAALGAILRLGGKRLLTMVILMEVALTGASLVRVWTSTEAALPSTITAAVADKPLRFAADKENVLIVFLDRFMGGFVEDILAQEPELSTALDGFTWYPRTIAAGENTIAGLHPLLGGYDYTPREIDARHQPLRNTAVESWTILPTNFTRRGYRVNLLNPGSLGFTIDGDCNFLELDGVHCSHVSPAVTEQYAARYGMPVTELAREGFGDLLTLLGAMRLVPYGMREIISERGPWKPFLDHTAGVTFREWAFLKALPELSTVDSGPPALNIAFSNLPHEPYFMGEDCLPKRTRLALSPESMRRSGQDNSFAVQHYVAARCSLLLVADYFRWMRTAGVYDSTKIVIVSDHGIIGPVTDHSSRAVAGGTTDSEFVRSRSVLMVKERSAHGALRTTDDFLPNAEVPRIVCEDIGGCTNPHFDDRTIEAHGRDDPFYVTSTPFQFNLQKRDGFDVLGEWAVIHRDPYQRENWVKVSPR